MEGAGAGEADLGVPVIERLPPLLLVEQRERAEAAFRAGGDALKQVLEMADHSLNRFTFEQVGGILKMTTQGAGALGQNQRQIEHGGPGVQLYLPQLEPSDLCLLLLKIEVDKADLKQRIPRHVAPRPQFLHEPRERQILMGIS